MGFWSVDSVNCRSKFQYMVGWICWHEKWSESESHSVVSDSCNRMDCSPPGSSVHGILQARTLEWVAIPFSRESSWPRDRTWVSCIAGGFFTIWATRKAHDGTCSFYNNFSRLCKSLKSLNSVKGYSILVKSQPCEILEMDGKLESFIVQLRCFMFEEIKTQRD